MVCSRFLNNNSHFSFSALHFRQAQILEFDRQRVAKIAKEFFYIPQVEHTSSSSSKGISSDSLYTTTTAGTGDEGVNPAALRTILSDTASIDLLSGQSTGTASHTAIHHRNHSTTYTTKANNVNSTTATTANNNSTLTTHTISSTIAEADQNADLSDQAVDVLKSNIHSWLVEEATLGEILLYKLPSWHLI